jgi:hypothetical protein
MNMTLKEYKEFHQTRLDGIKKQIGELENLLNSIKPYQMSFNLQYLQLQNQMQTENRTYTMISDTLKTKHDSAKNAIQNAK